jgi:mono/diheme cytochrome c family protein
MSKTEENMKRAIAGVLLGVLVAGTVWAADAPATYDKKCKACHTIGGVGGPMAKLGGPLDGVGAKHDEAWLKAYIENPKSKEPKSKMPAVKLTDEEMKEVVSYLSGLKK